MKREADDDEDPDEDDALKVEFSDGDANEATAASVGTVFCRGGASVASATHTDPRCLKYRCLRTKRTSKPCELTWFGAMVR